MRNYGISAVKLDGSGTGVAEVFLHRYRRNRDTGTIGLQPGMPVKFNEVARLIGRGDQVFVVRLSAAAGDFEAIGPVHLERGQLEYLNRHRQDAGVRRAVLTELPKYD